MRHLFESAASNCIFINQHYILCFWEIRNRFHWPYCLRKVYHAPCVVEHKHPRKCSPLHWRHNERGSVSNHQRLDCLLNSFLRRRSKKTSKLRATGLCEGNPPVTGGFPSQSASNAEKASIWWRCHVVEYHEFSIRRFRITDNTWIYNNIFHALLALRVDSMPNLEMFILFARTSS